MAEEDEQGANEQQSSPVDPLSRLREDLLSLVGSLPLERSQGLGPRRGITRSAIPKYIWTPDVTHSDLLRKVRAAFEELGLRADTLQENLPARSRHRAQEALRRLEWTIQFHEIVLPRGREDDFWAETEVRKLIADQVSWSLDTLQAAMEMMSTTDDGTAEAATGGGDEGVPAPQPPEEKPDGLEPPNRLRWKGKVYRLQKRSWDLLCHMWDKDTSPEIDVTTKVWGNSTIVDSTLRSGLNRLNTFLSKNGINLGWHLILDDGDICKERHRQAT